MTIVVLGSTSTVWEWVDSIDSHTFLALLCISCMVGIAAAWMTSRWMQH